MFVDLVTVHLRAGNGGAGVVAFRRQKGRPKGRPEGGSGGDGGDVVVEADDSVPTLLRYRRQPHHAAGDGTHGEGDVRHGRRGDDVVLPVPPGTVVRDAAGVVVADLVEPGQQVRVLAGGRGGRGNVALQSRAHRAPGFAEQGEYGEEGTFTFEMKLLADAALVGFPNAGKSTLIARVSAARPKIADYPFTTLQPNLGVVSVGEQEFVLADIPGLIEGAAEGRGLGHEFLRHVERAMVLVLLLDPSPLQDRAPVDQYRVLDAELAAHAVALAQRPRLVALTKADLHPDVDPDQLAATIGHDRVFPISGVTGEGVAELMYAIVTLVDRTVDRVPEREGFVLHRPVPPAFEVRRAGAVWEVVGRDASRAVNLDDLTKPEAADVAAARLARLGVDAALEAAGVRAGDDVRIGDLVFTYEPEQEPWEDEWDDGDEAEAEVVR
ncbi:MAG: GTPase ObgE [Acidimicrobiia bacterium]